MQLCALVLNIDGLWFACYIGEWALDPLIICIYRLSVNPKALLELDLKDIFGFKPQFSAREFELAPVYIFRKESRLTYVSTSPSIAAHPVIMPF